MQVSKAMGLPPVPPVVKSVRPVDFRCECVCIEVQRILDARKQKECQVFSNAVNFAVLPPTLPLVDMNQNPLLTVNWRVCDDIVCLGAIFKENLKDQIFVIEKPPQDFTVEPLGGTPPAARVTVTVTPGKDPATKNTVLVHLQNNTPLRTPTDGFLEVSTISFVKRPVLFFPDQEMVGQVSVKSESSWEILDCTVDLFLNALRANVSVGAFMIIKTWADVQLVTTAMGECDWDLIPPGPEDQCDLFRTRLFPPFNPPQLDDFLEPPAQGR